MPVAAVTAPPAVAPRAAPAAPTAPTAPTSIIAPDFVPKILTVAWMAILLGFAVELILLVVAAGMSGGLGKPAPFVADLIQKVSWSFLVCVGIGVGTAALRARPVVMGVLGLVAAPMAFTVAKALHKGATAALGLAGVAGGPSPLLVAAIKAVQYGLFGVLLGMISRRPGTSLGVYGLVGLGVGVVFGGVVTALIAQAGASGSALVTRALNELIFPLGCALVLYVADAFKAKSE